jgi:hypothetical protein
LNNRSLHVESKLTPHQEHLIDRSELIKLVNDGDLDVSNINLHGVVTLMKRRLMYLTASLARYGTRVMIQQGRL